MPGNDGRITVLVFVRDVMAPDCDMRSAPSLLSRERVDDIRSALNGLERDVTRVVVVKDPVAHGFRFNDEVSVPVHVVCDPTVNDLYRRSVGAFVIDADGTIVAMDETWGVTPDFFGRPKGAYRELRAFEIRDAVDCLLRP